MWRTRSRFIHSCCRGGARRAGAARGAAARATEGAVCVAQGGARAPKKSHPVLFRSKSAIFAFIAAERDRCGVAALCRRYGVTRAGFYAWQRRRPSRHSRDDARLLERVRAVFAASGGRYGAARIHAALSQAGCRLGCKRVARLMCEAGLRARAASFYRRTGGTRAFFTAIPYRLPATRAHRQRLHGVVLALAQGRSHPWPPLRLRCAAAPDHRSVHASLQPPSSAFGARLPCAD
jgi:hypothetical protein